MNINHQKTKKVTEHTYKEQYENMKREYLMNMLKKSCIIIFGYPGCPHYENAKQTLKEHQKKYNYTLQIHDTAYGSLVSDIVSIKTKNFTHTTSPYIKITNKSKTIFEGGNSEFQRIFIL